MPDVKFSNLYPYTDFHELNLEWVIKEVKYWSTRVGKTIQSIELTGTAGLVDTYTITYSDGTTSTFDVTNGNGIASVAKTGTVGLVDTYTITFQDGSTTTFEVHNGTASIDPTLTVPDYAADAKATGDAIDRIINGSQNFTDGYGLLTDGTTVETPNVSVSDYIPVTAGHNITVLTSSATPSPNINIRLIEYNSAKVTVDYWSANPYKTVNLSANTAFIRFSFDTGYAATATDNTTSSLLYTAETFPSLNDRVDSEATNIINNTDWDDTIPNARHDPLTNYIDKTQLLEDMRISSITGNVTSSGASGLYASDFIPVSAGDVLYHGNGVYVLYYAYYDIDRTFLPSAVDYNEDLTNPFTIPNDAAYMRVTILGTYLNNAWIFYQNGKPDDYKLQYYFGEKMTDASRNALKYDDIPTNFTGSDIQAFDSGICIGDSLTEGIFNYDDNGDTGYIGIPEMSYPSALQRMTGITITNAGESGDTSAEWYAAHSSDDLSGNKFAIIQFGVNDVTRYGPGWTATSSTAYTNIINKLKTDNAKIKIFIATVMPAVSYPASNYETFNAGLKSFVENLNDSDVILLDMAAYGNTGSLQYNAGHLSAYGYWRLAKDYASYISWYMYNNGMEFREIQFIGTNYHY